MEIEFTFQGRVTEWQELLNGTRSVTVEGASDDGSWRVIVTASWNLGLLEFEGEGDVSLSHADGEVYGPLVEARAQAPDGGEEGAEWVVTCEFDVDGGTRAYEAGRGTVAIILSLRGEEAGGDARLKLSST